MDTKKMIGSRINSALAYSNKKQKELASYLGVPDNTISYFCSGKRVPNAEQIIKISEFLNVSSDYLLGLNKYPTTDKDISFISEYTGLTKESIDYFHAAALMAELADLDFADDSDFDDEIKDEIKAGAKDYSNGHLNIINWIISNGFFEEIATILLLLDGNTKHFFKEAEKSKQDRSFNDMYDIYTNCDVQRYKLVQLSELMANHFHNPQKMYQQLDMPKMGIMPNYSPLVNILEKSMLSHKSNKAKEASENGKHNPPKE